MLQRLWVYFALLRNTFTVTLVKFDLNKLLLPAQMLWWQTLSHKRKRHPVIVTEWHFCLVAQFYYILSEKFKISFSYLANYRDFMAISMKIIKYSSLTRRYYLTRHSRFFLRHKQCKLFTFFVCTFFMFQIVFTTISRKIRKKESLSTHRGPIYVIVTCSNVTRVWHVT